MGRLAPVDLRGGGECQNAPFGHGLEGGDNQIAYRAVFQDVMIAFIYFLAGNHEGHKVGSGGDVDAAVGDQNDRDIQPTGYLVDESLIIFGQASASIQTIMNSPASYGD